MSPLHTSQYRWNILAFLVTLALLCGTIQMKDTTPRPSLNLIESVAPLHENSWTFSPSHFYQSDYRNLQQRGPRGSDSSNNNTSNESNSSNSTNGSNTCSNITDCFNCSLSEDCSWKDQECVELSSLPEEDRINTVVCTDSDNLCTTNGLENQTIDSGDKVYFQMVPNEQGFIPPNYYCLWGMMLSLNLNYTINVTRYYSTTYEEYENLQFIAYTTDSVYQVQNKQTIPYDETNSVTIQVQDSYELYVFALNNMYYSNFTFLITIESVEEESSSNSYLGIIAMVLFIILTIFVCICMICIIRICMNRRRYEENIMNQVQQQEDDRQQQQVQQQQIQQRLKEIMALIVEKKYDKRVDEFKQTECSICFEEFQKHDPIKKIPICRHMFHSKCIDHWFESRIEEDVQKCPLCNAEITVDTLKDALKKKKQDRRKEIQDQISQPNAPVHKIHPERNQRRSIPQHQQNPAIQAHGPADQPVIQHNNQIEMRSSTHSHENSIEMNGQPNAFQSRNIVAAVSNMHVVNYTEEQAAQQQQQQQQKAHEGRRQMPVQNQPPDSQILDNSQSQILQRRN